MAALILLIFGFGLIIYNFGIIIYVFYSRNKFLNENFRPFLNIFVEKKERSAFEKYVATREKMSDLEDLISKKKNQITMAQINLLSSTPSH